MGLGLIFNLVFTINPPCAQAIESTNAHYDRVAEEYEKRHAGSSPELDKLRALFVSQLPHGARVGDLGCGPGRDVVFFQGLGFTVVAIDPVAAMIERVKSKIYGSSHAVQALAHEMEFEGHVDAFWASASLIHIPAELMEASLKRMALKLKPGGFILASMVSGVGNPDVGEIEPKGRFFNRMTEATMRAIIAKIPELEVDESLSTRNADDYHGDKKPTATFGFYNLFIRKKS